MNTFKQLGLPLNGMISTLKEEWKTLNPVLCNRGNHPQIKDWQALEQRQILIEKLLSTYEDSLDDLELLLKSDKNTERFINE